MQSLGVLYGTDLYVEITPHTVNHKAIGEYNSQYIFKCN